MGIIREVTYSFGYSIGFVAMLGLIFSPALLIAHRRGRRMWMLPVLRRIVDGRWRKPRPDQARIDQLQRELELYDSL